MSTPEQGLDRREWETQMAALEDQLRDDPREALPDLVDLVGGMLEERGFQLDEPVTRAGEEPEVVAEYLAARDTARRVERDQADPSDVGEAIHGLRAVYEHLIVERSAP